MPGRLRSHVHVRDDNNVAHVFGPDDEIPDWAAAKITNPNAWAGPPELAEDASAPDNGAAGTEQPSAGPAKPPKVGTGSSREDWAAYAATLGLDPRDATKADIIAAVEAAEQQ